MIPVPYARVRTTYPNLRSRSTRPVPGPAGCAPRRAHMKLQLASYSSMINQSSYM